MRSSWWIAVAAVACSKRDDAPHAAPDPSPPPVVAARDAAIDAAAEAMTVTEMAVHGFLRIEDDSGRHEEPLPESPLGHGEFPEGCFALPDGTVFAVGKQYTGVDGPDDGAIWKRTPDGTWSTAFRLERRAISSITGLAPDDIVAGTAHGYIWFDGKTWSVRDLPQDSAHVWSEGRAIFAQDFDRTTTIRIEKGHPHVVAPSKHDWGGDKYVCTSSKVHYRVFDKDRPIGQRAVSPKEAGEIRDEMKSIEAHPERIRPVKP